MSSLCICPTRKSLSFESSYSAFFVEKAFVVPFRDLKQLYDSSHCFVFNEDLAAVSSLSEKMVTIALAT